MIARLPILLLQHWPDYARWAACFSLALLMHMAGALAMLTRWDDTDLTANPPAIIIDLAPMPMAPELAPTDLPDGPQQVETPPEQEPPPPEPAIQIDPPKPPPKPPEKKKMAKLTMAPVPAERRLPVAAAPMPGAGSHDPTALPNWKSLLVAQIERNKRYPSEARSRGEHGVAQLAFSVDRQGGVHNERIIHSSGSSALDAETLATVRRASPLPPPPPEFAGGLIPVIVPIRYNLH